MLAFLTFFKYIELAFGLCLAYMAQSGIITTILRQNGAFPFLKREIGYILGGYQ